MQNNSYQQIAKEFMDLWQKQVSAVITDKQFIHSMLEMFQSMQMPDYDRKSSTAASEPTAAPHADNELLAELAFRLSMCEKRIAALEHKKPAKKATSQSSAGRTAKSHPRGSTKPRK